MSLKKKEPNWLGHQQKGVSWDKDEAPLDSQSHMSESRGPLRKVLPGEAWLWAAPSPGR